MNRVDKLRKESNESNRNNTSVVVGANSTNSTNNINDNNIFVESESRNENSQLLQRQIAEEKAAAKIFPLSLISNRFKSKDPNTLKSKSSSCS